MRCLMMMTNLARQQQRELDMKHQRNEKHYIRVRRSSRVRRPSCTRSTTLTRRPVSAGSRPRKRLRAKAPELLKKTGWSPISEVPRIKLMIWWEGFILTVGRLLSSDHVLSTRACSPRGGTGPFLSYLERLDCLWIVWTGSLSSLIVLTIKITELYLINHSFALLHSFLLLQYPEPLKI